MILWTAAVVYDLALALLSGGLLTTVLNGDIVSEQAGALFQGYWQGFWGPAAQARAIVWGLPMTAFTMIAAYTRA